MRTTNTPGVTVLMPVFNGERHLKAAIDSVLRQTYADFEFVIVDDGSTDGSAAIVASCTDDRIRLIRLPSNAGLSHALNAGLQSARAPLVARQDADDLAEPSRLERQVEWLTSRPDVALLGSQAVAIADDGHPTGVVRRPVGPESIRWFSVFDNPFIHTSVMFRAAAVREAGGYDAAFDPFSQDYDLWCRVMHTHAVANLDEPLVRYRVNESSIMGSLRDDEKGRAYAQRFSEVVQTLTLRQARRLFGDTAVAEADGDLLAALVRGIPAARVLPFLALFERLLATFRSGGDPEDTIGLAATLERQFEALAFHITPPSRRSLVRIYAHVLRHHPELATRINWAKTAGMLVVGRTGRERLGRWWRQ